MAKKKAKQNQKRLVVSMRPVATADAEERIQRAIDILLKAAARKEGQNSEEGKGG